MSNETINPADMGTTGLVNFVLACRGGKRYSRLRKAVSVVRGRYGAKAIPFFCKAVWASVSTNVYERRGVARHLAMFGFTAG